MPTTQPCDPIRKLHRFTVSGWGQFPIDMLRYDSCWPATEARATSAIMASYDRGSRELRSVELVGLRQPTDDRWKSFGWAVTA